MLHSLVSNKNPSDKSSQNLHHINLDKLSGALKLKAGRIKALICSKALSSMFPVKIFTSYPLIVII